MKYLNDYTEDKQTELFKHTGSFFAFSKEQYKEERQPGVNTLIWGVV